ncbi:hypothetical protein Tco_0995339 [Tanacetum coccineum]
MGRGGRWGEGRWVVWEWDGWKKEGGGLNEGEECLGGSTVVVVEVDCGAGRVLGGGGVVRWVQDPSRMFLTVGRGGVALGWVPGYVFLMNGGAVTWRRTKQNTAALSSTEVKADYIVFSQAAQLS